MLGTLVVASARAQPVPANDPIPASAKFIQINSAADSPPMLIATWKENEGYFYSVSLDGATFTEPRATEYKVLLRQATFDPGVMPQPEPAMLPSARGKNLEGASLHIVQFYAPPNEPIYAGLMQLGAHPLAYLPDFAQVVEMNAEVRQQVGALPYVRWVGPYHTAYKLEESLLNELALRPGEGRQTATVPTRRYSIMLFERGPAAQKIVIDRVRALGGILNAENPEGFRIEATLTANQLLEIVSMNQVQFIDKWGPAGVDMNIAREIGGATPLLNGLGFSGQGVRGEVMDSGIRQTHLGFQSPSILVHGINPDVQSHGTSTYGIVFGNGAGNASGTGLLPNRQQGIFADYNTLTSNGGTVSRYTHTAELVNTAGPYRAVFQSNSWGNINVTTLYNTVSAEMDDILFINDILICQSQSNQNSQNSRPEAWAKNILSVGGITHQNTLTRTDDTFTTASYGPAADGRVKPDVAHFYDNVTTTTSSSDTAYTTTFNGTSAATPITCGYVGLLHQMWHEQVFDGFGGGASVFASRPHMSTAKALLVNSAYRYNWLNGGSNGNINRTKQGWGMADLARLYNDRAKTFVVDETDVLLPFGSKTYQFEVGPGEPELRITMVYTDPKGNVGSPAAAINDLSLRVTDPEGTTYWGNNGLTASNYSTAGGIPNTRDTVENVFVQNPAPGMWQFRVEATAIVQDARPQTPELDADYALVVVGVVIPVPCPADVSGDGVVNVTDLLAVINAWGTCAGCPADINSDGVVNVSDLLAVINAWGPCPQ